MDTRTEQEKIDDSANKVEKVIVVAPSASMVKDWCEVRHISQHRVIPVFNGRDAQHKLQSTRELPHVILGWGYFSDDDKDMIRAYLEITHAVPYSDEGRADVADPTADLRV